MAAYINLLIMLLIGIYFAVSAKTVVKDTDPSYPKKVKLFRVCGIVMIICASILMIVKVTGN